MKITIDLPDDTFGLYKKAAELVQKNYPFINPATAAAPRLFEMLIISDLPDADKIKPTILAQKFIKAVNRVHNIELKEEDEDPADQILKEHPSTTK